MGGVEAVGEFLRQADFAKRAGVEAAADPHIGRRIHARVLVGGELHVVVAAHFGAMLIVLWSVARQQATLKEQRRKLGAALDDLEVIEQLQRLAGAMGLSLQEVIARATAQVLGLADVQRLALLIAHDVNPRSGWQFLRERDLVIVASRSWLAKARHLLERGHALLFELGEKDL